MLGTHDKTLCGWTVTIGELAQLKKMDNKYVNCKRCLDKLNAAEVFESSRSKPNRKPGASLSV